MNGRPRRSECCSNKSSFRTILTSLFASLLLLCLLSTPVSAADSEVWTKATRPTGLKGSLGLLTGFRLGITDLSGSPSRVLRDAITFELVIGLRVWRLSIEGFAEPTGGGVTREFIRSSGYTKPFVDQMKHLALGLLGGYHLYDSYGFRVTPLIGVRWDEVFENWPVAHPNWDLYSKSSAGLVGGLRLEFNPVKSGRPTDRFILQHWLYFQIIVAELKYDNPEYGHGHMVGLTVGYTFEGMLGK